MTWQENLRKVLRGAAVAAVGAVVPVLLQLSGTLDDGTAQGAILAAVCAIAANALRKFVLGG